MQYVNELMAEIAEKREFCDNFLNYDSGMKIYDAINYIADDSVDIYTDSLLDWAKNNYWAIEDAVKEYGVYSENFDFIKLIQQGQYYEAEQEIYSNLQAYLKYYVLNACERETISDEQLAKIESFCADFDTSSTFAELENFASSL